MAKQQLKTEQFNLMVNGTLYKGCYFRGGITTGTVVNETDHDFDTGVPKFPNNLLAWGVTPGWTSTTWDQNYKSGILFQGTTNLRLGIHMRVGSTLSKDLAWWAIGN